jgi:hypothetical protein
MQIHKSDLTVDELTEELKSKYNFRNRITSTSKRGTMVFNEGDTFEFINFFILKTTDNHTMTIALFSGSNYEKIPMLGHAYSSFRMEDLLALIPNTIQQKSQAVRYLAANSDDVGALVNKILTAQSNIIDKKTRESSQLEWYIENMVPHVKKAFSHLIPKRFRTDLNEPL